MLQRSKQQRFTLKVTDGLFVLRRIEGCLHHLFHGARRITKVCIFWKKNPPHAPAADASNDFVTRIEHCSGVELLDCRFVSASSPSRRRGGSRGGLVSVGAEKRKKRP